LARIYLNALACVNRLTVILTGIAIAVVAPDGAIVLQLTGHQAVNSAQNPDDFRRRQPSLLSSIRSVPARLVLVTKN
jgi:hypothetical protein